MSDVLSVLSRLPGIAFATLATTGETIAICFGAPSYYRVNTTKSAEELNAMYGVSRAQARAMLAGIMLGWNTLLADPASYDAQGKLLRVEETTRPPMQTRAPTAALPDDAGPGRRSG